MANQLLLLEDVDALGRSGDLVSVKPGYARNFLIPQKKAVVATKNALRMQERLREERSKRAVVDKAEADVMKEKLEGKELTTIVKVDQEGHMYGSVSALDIVHLFEKEGVKLEKRAIVLAHPIKQLGVYPLTLRLKEDVKCSYVLKVEAEAPEKGI